MDLERGLVHVQERYYRGDTDEPKTDKSKRPLPLGYLAKEFRKLRSEAEAERQKLGGHEYVFHKEDGKPLDDRDVLRDIIRPPPNGSTCILRDSAGTPSAGRTST